MKIYILCLSVLNIASFAYAKCSDPAGPKVNWSGCNKSGLNLSGVNLSGADLKGINLNGANLSHANLSNANFEATGFTYNSTNLGNINLSNANLSGANLHGFINLDGANLDEANFTDAKITGTNVKIRYAHGKNVNFTRAKLMGIDFEQTSFTTTSFFGATLSNISAHRDVTFTNSNFEKALFTDPNAGTPTNFSTANLSGSNFKNAKMSFTSFKKANLTNADFSGADLEYTNFTGANLAYARGMKIITQDSWWDWAIREATLLSNANLYQAQIINNSNDHIVCGKEGYMGKFIEGTNFSNATIENGSKQCMEGSINCCKL